MRAKSWTIVVTHMTEKEISPGLKSWIDNVIVPALVREWIERNSPESGMKKENSQDMGSQEDATQKIESQRHGS